MGYEICNYNTPISQNYLLLSLSISIYFSVTDPHNLFLNAVTHSFINNISF